MKENVYVLNNSTINVFDKNINIFFDINKQFINKLESYNKDEIISDKIYLFCDNLLITINNFIFIKGESKNNVHLVVISNDIFQFNNPLQYLRNEKIKKIIYDISEKSI